MAQYKFDSYLFPEAVDPAHPEPGPAPGPQRRVAPPAARELQRSRNSLDGGLSLGVLRGQDEVPEPRAGAEEGGTQGICTAYSMLLDTGAVGCVSSGLTHHNSFCEWPRKNGIWPSSQKYTRSIFSVGQPN